MTTYDEIWETFLSKCKTEDINIPTSEERIYKTIHNGVLAFNTRLEDDLQCDHESEQLNRQLTDSELLILAHFIRKDILENQLIYFSTTFSPFTKDIGHRNLTNQIVRLENLVENEMKIIDSIITKMAEDFL